MEAKHTPGPWHTVETEPGIDADTDVFVQTPRWAGGKSLVARVTDADDAVLIAAAPDLLEALQAIIGHDAHLLNPWRVEAARAAIAKATGEQA
jgi:hypothetical protein